LKVENNYDMTAHYYSFHCALCNGRYIEFDSYMYRRTGPQIKYSKVSTCQLVPKRTIVIDCIELSNHQSIASTSDCCTVMPIVIFKGRKIESLDLIIFFKLRSCSGMNAVL
jgi:hypothetical protein